MSNDKTESEDKPAKGKGFVMKLVVVVGLIAAGGGGVFGMMQAGIIGDAVEEKEDNSPKFVRKDDEDPYTVPGDDKGANDIPMVHGEGGSEFRKSYFSFSDDFTSNLKDSSALVQVSIAASTQRDGRVLMWMKGHELAIRSEMLSVLADTPEDEIHTRQGKEQLQKRLTQAINKILQETEGFGGVEAVYFKSFIVQ
ncbi:MAG: flagellar basal body-associated FliL family protein [Sphingomonadaceae bacterium]|nr:flagellar basal body-associated FliL family protein [Sphingomonadaceae bacterium]